jgi:hypothetical protein
MDLKESRVHHCRWTVSPERWTQRVQNCNNCIGCNNFFNELWLPLDNSPDLEDVCEKPQPLARQSVKQENSCEHSFALTGLLRHSSSYRILVLVLHHKFFNVETCCRHNAHDDAYISSNVLVIPVLSARGA